MSHGGQPYCLKSVKQMLDALLRWTEDKCQNWEWFKINSMVKFINLSIDV